MPFDEDGAETISPAAALDELELRQVAADLTRFEAPARVSFKDGLESLLGEMYAMQRAEWRERTAALERRIVELEQQQGALKYSGVWKAGGDYMPGEFVTDKGALWYCKAHTGTRPSSCHEAWRLAAKSAR